MNITIRIKSPFRVIVTTHTEELEASYERGYRDAMRDAIQGTKVDVESKHKDDT